MATETLDLTVDGRTVSVSNADRLVFPTSGVSKGDVARYYQRIGPTMVPHIGNRPVTLVRYPKGIDGEGFFQKNTPDHYPDWIPRVELEKKGGVVRHPVVDHPAALVYFAQQGVITPHMGLALADALGRPNLFAVDLDPSTDDFDQVRAVALGVKQALERAGLVPFVQLTGSKGVHVLAPLSGAVGWSDVQRFGRALTSLLMKQFADDLTTEFSKADRGDRIYLDMGRNNYQATIAAPYGIRAIEGAPVVCPIPWDELSEPDMHPRRFTIHTVFDRLATRGDPFAGLPSSARPLPAA